MTRWMLIIIVACLMMVPSLVLSTSINTETNGLCTKEFLGLNCSIEVTGSVTILSTISWSWSVQSNTFFARLSSNGGSSDNPINWIGLMFGANDGMTNGAMMVFHANGNRSVEVAEFFSHGFEQPTDTRRDYVEDLLSFSDGQDFDVMFSRPCQPADSTSLMLPTTAGINLAVSIAFGPHRYPDWGYHGINRARLVVDLLAGQATLSGDPSLATLYAPIVCLVGLLLLGGLIIRFSFIRNSTLLHWKLPRLNLGTSRVQLHSEISAPSSLDEMTEPKVGIVHPLEIMADGGQHLRHNGSLAILFTIVDTMSFNAISTLLSMTLEQLLVVGLYLASVIAFVVIGSAKHFTWTIVFGHLTAIHLTATFYPITRNSIILILFNISFERALVYHRTLGRLSILFVAVHIYYNVMKFGGDILFNKDPLPNGDGPIYGSISVLCFLIMLVTAFENVRRVAFELFYWLHIPLALTAAALAMVHSIYTRYYLIAPLALYLVDRAVRMYRSHRQVSVTGLAVYGSRPNRIVSLSIRGSWLKFQPGQYAFVRVPSLSSFQWHPFSFSCTPANDTLTFHMLEMKTCLPYEQVTFTQALADVVEQQIDSYEQESKVSTANTHIRSISKVAVPIIVNIDGPYGQLSLPLNSGDYNMVVLVAGGIGVTPLISVLDWLISTDLSNLDQIVFVWSARVKTMILDLFPQILERAVNSSRCKVLLYHTQDDSQGTKTIGDVEANCILHIKRGRPKIPEIFSQMSGNLLRKQKVAVLACGPRSLVNEVEYCAISSGFHFHKEIFQL